MLSLPCKRKSEKNQRKSANLATIALFSLSLVLPPEDRPLHFSLLQSRYGGQVVARTCTTLQQQFLGPSNIQLGCMPRTDSISTTDLSGTESHDSRIARFANCRPGMGSQHLSGMFRRSASLVIPHLKGFAAIPCVSLAQLGHTNRNVFLSHESQRRNCPRLGTFKTNSLLPTRRSGGSKMACVSQCLCF